VTLSDLNDDQGQETLAQLVAQYGRDKVNFVQCDVTKEDQLENLFAESEKFFGKPVDIFVNNAGINTNLGWRKCMEVNILAVLSATEMALKHMQGRSHCKIVNLASVAGLVPSPEPESASYFISKRGVVTLSRTLAANRTTHNVDILCLCPGWADTAIVSEVREDLKPTVNQHVKKMGLMKVERVGEAFMQLLASKNGTVLSVMANLPMLEIPDTSVPEVFGGMAICKVLNKMFGIELGESWHFVLFCTIIFLMINFLVKFIFC